MAMKCKEFRDSTPDKTTKQILLERYSALLGISTGAQLVQQMKTRADLITFYDDVRAVSWPECFGDSPWGFASLTAFIVTHPGNITNPHVLNSEEFKTAQEYLAQ